MSTRTKARHLRPSVAVPSPEKLELLAAYNGSPYVVYSDGTNDEMPSPTPRKISLSQQTTYPAAPATRIPRLSSSHSPQEASPPPYTLEATPPPTSHPDTPAQPSAIPLQRSNSNFHSMSPLPSPNDPTNTSPWSSAVGRASQTGKSGRVIEKLQSENDRLRRELKLAQLQKDEEAKRAEHARTALESLRSVNENLSSQASLEGRAVERKERALERVKDELKKERALRLKEGADAVAERAEAEGKIERLAEELRREAEEGRLWRSRHDVLSGGWKGLKEAQQRKLENLRRDLDTLMTARQQDALKIVRVETVNALQCEEMERMRKANEGLWKVHEQYKAEIEREVEGLRTEATAVQERSGNLLEESQKVVGEMRWVMGVRRNVKLAGSHEAEEAQHQRQHSDEKEVIPAMSPTKHVVDYQRPSPMEHATPLFSPDRVVSDTPSGESISPPSTAPADTHKDLPTRTPVSRRGTQSSSSATGASAPSILSPVGPQKENQMPDGEVKTRPRGLSRMKSTKKLFGFGGEKGEKERGKLSKRESREVARKRVSQA